MLEVMPAEADIYHFPKIHGNLPGAADAEQ